jgi:hypothetical protein
METSLATAVNENQTSLIVAAQQAGGVVLEAVAPTVVYAPEFEQKATGFEMLIALIHSSFAGCAKISIGKQSKTKVEKIVKVECFIFSISFLLILSQVKFIHFQRMSKGIVYSFNIKIIYYLQIHQLLYDFKKKKTKTSENFQKNGFRQ